jgi:hypothetical protein
MPTAPSYDDLEFRAVESAHVSAEERVAMHALFDVCYAQANHAYLDKSYETLRYVAMAWRGDELAGFALAEERVLDLPRLPGTHVSLAGIACIGAAYRRRHLFVMLEHRAALAAGLGMQHAPRVLGCGRMAHPASFRGMTRNPTVVPRRGSQPTPWQQEVGRAIAEAYGVRDFDPRTFVVHGSGAPIGYPVVEMGDIAPGEWEVFREVNRDRGDSLLGIAWTPQAPEGWDRE